MKCQRRWIRCWFVLIGLLTAGVSWAELYPVTLEQRTALAARIAIGQVTKQHTYWVEGQGAVTASTVKVAAWLKGPGADSEILVLALGGVVGDRATVVQPTLHLQVAQEYLLFLDAEETRQDDRELRRSRPELRQSFAYADAQGALPLQKAKYRDMFGAPLAPSEALNRIAGWVGILARTPAGDAYAPARVSPGDPFALLPITSFSPNPSNGGTIVPADFLTITGSSFGAGAGTVFYTNADDGGATFTATGVASDNVSWADGAIANKIAPNAGTGPINVNGAMTSGSNLTVNWGHTAINSTFSGFAQTTRQRYYQRNMDGSGGLSFRYNTTSGFSANAPAVAAFERALTSWRCAVGVNFKTGGTTATGFAADGVNIVMFDGTLPAGVLGRATSRFNGGANGACMLQNTVWGLTEVDVQFFTDPPSPGFPWEYGPAAPAFTEYDFQSVAVHELGHGIGLQHRIAAGQVMHFAIANGSSARNPAALEVQGAQVKMDYSDDATCFNPGALGSGPMVPVAPAVCDLGTPQADVVITKTDGAANEVPGTAVTYTIVASNTAGPSGATGVTVADNFPGILTGCSTSSVAVGGATGHDAGPTAGNINDSGITLPVGGSVTYTATCTIGAAATGSLANTASVNSAVSDPTPGNNGATDTDSLEPTADLAITKSDGVTAESPGTPVTYFIVARNTAGPSVATGVTVADTFAAELSGCSTTSVATGGVTGNDLGPTAGNINDGGITLPVGSNVTYTATCNISAAATGNLTNTASVSSALTDPTPGNNSATDVDALVAIANLAISKTDGVAAETPGTQVTYTIVASNAGPATVADGVVADTFPGTLSGCSTTSIAGGGASGNDSGPSAGNINDGGLTIPTGGSVTYTATCNIDAAATGTLVNTATISSAGSNDPTPANNIATDTDSLIPIADLAINKTDGAAIESPGTPVTYTIVASNSAGPSVATSVTVSDTFPATLSGCSTTSVAAGGATGHDTGPSAGNINDSDITLPVGSLVTYTSTCDIDPAATNVLENTASVSSTVSDPTAANNTAIDADTLLPQFDIEVSKTDFTTVAYSGEATSYAITAYNSGPSSAADTTLTDNVPAGCSGFSWTCGGLLGGSCAPSGSGAINDTIQLPVTASVTYLVDCSIALGATGTLVNTVAIANPNDTAAGNNQATDTDVLISDVIFRNGFQ